MTINEKTGTYQAVAPGTAVITAKTGNLSCELKVEVYIPVEDIKGVSEKVSLEIGGTKKITYSVVPEEIEDKAEFLSSDTSVATVSEDGVITAKGAGTAQISVTVRNCKKTVTVEVKKVEGREEKETKPANNENEDKTPDTVEEPEKEQEQETNDAPPAENSENPPSEGREIASNS